MDRLRYLLQQYAANIATAEEVKEFFGILKKHYNDEQVKTLLMQLIEKTDMEEYDKERWDIVLQKALKPQPSKVITMHSKRFSMTRIAAAAAIILLLTIGGYFYFNTKSLRQAQRDNVVKDDVAPGKPGAILTLADGKQIVLDSAANGKISKDAVKNGNEISYVNADDNVAENNTMSTPNGRQFKLVLSDGTGVWLNAASSITYPTAFTGSERKVQITGEVYFEVAHNAKQPFTVIAHGTAIHDIGTAFNVNAYSNEEKIKVTLVEGSIKVETVVLKPGQQAQVANDIKVVAANINEVIAWKNGQFRFEGQDIETIMRQLSRWYDVEINYKVKTNKHFTGIISRNVNASEVLKMLEMTGEMHFNIDGKKVTVEK
ncbi:MAG: anti-sigma factor [Chitinophagaceae bacterium]|nr:anti-sigma factor [Chitinophagaceae bacterium]